MQIANGNNLSRVKVTNQSAIRQMIYHDGPISRIEISEKLSLTLPTITTTVNFLLSKGLIKEVENTKASGKTLGRKASLIDISDDGGYFIGIETRGTLRRACITDYRGKLIKSIADDTAYSDYDEIMTETAELVKKLLRNSKIPKAKIAGIGLCIPGLVDRNKGKLIVLPGYEWKNKDLKGDLSRLLNYDGPISIENNACARAYGSYLFDHESMDHYHSFAYFMVSTGIACPLMYTHDRFRESIIGQGEVGHMVVDSHGPLCRCGNHGCLEAFSSERAIISNCISELNKGKADILRRICLNAESPTIYEIIKAQSEGDQSVNAILEDAVYHMGIGIANIDNFVRPKCILIDSNIFQNQKNKDQLMDIIHRNLYTATDIDTNFMFVEPDIYSGALGAAAAAVQNDLKTFIE
jgi:predicted NBD/HSP70 family sugar kinase